MRQSSSSEPRTRIIKFRVTQAEFVATHAKAHASGMTVTDLLRMGLRLGDKRRCHSDPRIAVLLSRVTIQLKIIADWTQWQMPSQDATAVISRLIQVERCIRQFAGGDGDAD